MTYTRPLHTAEELDRIWSEDARWHGIQRTFSSADVLRLRGTIPVEYSIARITAEKLWRYLHDKPFVNALGALTGNQAMQQVKAGLDAIYLSGWQVAGDANLAGEMYPDQSLYPADSVPAVVRRINNTLRRADQISHAEGKDDIDWLKPIVADAEAGFGGVLNAFELMKQLIAAGAAGVHFEDQLSSAKKCGHMGGKVLVPTQEAIDKLLAARLAADVCSVPSVLIARTDAESANLLTSDVDERDREFIDRSKARTREGFCYVRAGLAHAIARGLAYAPYADLIWCETATPDLSEAREFAEAIHRQFPGKLLAYNCSPSFNWKRKLDDATIAKFQIELAAMGYRFQFITLAGFHALNYSMFELAHQYKRHQMSAYVALQQAEFAAEPRGYTATKHQREVGAGYFDEVARTVSGGASETTALTGSTETQQFHGDKSAASAAQCVWDNFMLTPDAVPARVKDRADEAASKPKLQVVNSGVSGAA
jgi:isocitrate lyase